jgi:hypothetical protein
MLRVRLVPMLPRKCLRANTLRPSHNNVRRCVWRCAVLSTMCVTAPFLCKRRQTHEGIAQPATPLYNSSIMEDVCMLELLTHFHAVLLQVPIAAEAVVVLKVGLGAFVSVPPSMPAPTAPVYLVCRRYSDDGD